MYDEQYKGMVIMPAYHNGIQSQEEVTDAGIALVHTKMVLLKVNTLSKTMPRYLTAPGSQTYPWGISRYSLP